MRKANSEQCCEKCLRLLGVLFFVTCFSVAAASVSVGQDDVRLLEAAPVSVAIQVDGRLDEPDWQRARVATDFVQFEPTPGAPATRQSEVRVLYGPNALYVGAVLHDDPASVRAPLSRRNSAGDADIFQVTIDGHATGRTAYHFGVTAAGVQLDAIEEVGQIDYSWDAVWQSSVRHTNDGWVVEMAIPYSMLRFANRDEQTWWIQFERKLSRTGERVFWQPVSREEQGVGFIAGRLTNLRGISPRMNIQVRPYTLSRVTRAPDFGPEQGFFNETGFDVGADIKVGIGSDLIFDAAINPDFGQVEADPEVLNLSTFESFFPERRPFFLEGTSIFDYAFGPGDGPLLYTRRVGTLGRIVGAGKLTGRTRSGISFGVLGATTSDGFEDPETYTGEDFEPDLWYGAARVKREFGDRSFVGAALSYFDGFGSDFPGDHIRSAVLGTDFDLRMSQGTYRWDGALTLSQRRFKDVTTPETGFGLYTGIDKVRGLFTAGIGVRVFSDEFEPNDVGFFRENDILRVRAHAQRLLNEGQPFGPFRLAFIGASGDQTWTFRNRTNLGIVGRWYSWWYFTGYQRLIVRGNVANLGGYDVRESRGLGPVANLAGGSVIVEYSTDTRRDLVAHPRASFGLFDEGGVAWNVGLNTTWTASDRVALSFNTRYEQRDNVRAWVANETFRYDGNGFQLYDRPNRFPGSDPIFHPLGGSNSGYESLFSGFNPVTITDGFVDYYAAVFGGRDQRSIDTSVRATYTFRPNLSLQLYSQLFAARFRHDDFRLLLGPDDLEPIEAYPRRRDETRRSLNLNSVLRWEYRPGSTLFAVWTHGRLGFDGGYFIPEPGTGANSPYDRTTMRLALDTFELPPTNVFLIKLNYLLMR